MDKNKNRLFIHKDMEPVTLTHNVEIILTPQFYTFIREELDLNFAYQAKQIAGSFFDGYLDNSVEHQYHVSKCNGSWCFYAYNIQEIEDFLTSVGIEKNRVSKIYFAQELSNKLETPFQLSKKYVLQSIDDTVTMIPLSLLEENTNFTTLKLSEIKLNSSVTIGASKNSLISVKETLILSSLFVILGALFLVEGSRIKSSIQNDNEQLMQLLDENPRYASSMVRSSILEKYQPIDTNERQKRQTIQDISKLLSASSQLNNLNLEKSMIKATIKTSNQQTSRRVLQNAKAKKLKSSNNGLTVKVEKKI